MTDRASISGTPLGRMMLRRSFLGFLTEAAGLGAVVCCASAAPRRAAEDTRRRGAGYSVALLGDTHYDSPDVAEYHSDYTSDTTEKRFKAHLKEHRRNARMWKERMPRLLAASARCVTSDTAFVLQVGDLVQGDCGNPVVHRRMLGDMAKRVKRAYGTLPFVTVVGNHDIRGTLAREVYDEMMPPMMAAELKRPVAGTTFSFRHGPDAFVVVDFNEPRPDVAQLKRLLVECAGARHTFLVTHGPAIPSCMTRWFLLGGARTGSDELKARRDVERREILRLLAKRNAIVLAGHDHRVELHDLALPEGRVTQLVVNSVWAQQDASFNVIDEGVEAFGNRAKGDPELLQLAEEYRPYMKRYLFADAAGHYRLEVSDRRVAVQFYCGDAETPSRTFVLRG